MTPDRHGKKWEQHEDDLLFALVRSDDASLEQVAAMLQRTASAVCARLAVHVGGHQLSEHPDEAFAWARTELRKGGDGQPTWAAERADSVAVPVLEPLAEQRAEVAAKGGRYQEHLHDKARILRTWLSITGIQLTEDQRHDFLARRELSALAKFGVERIAAVGNELWTAHGRLALTRWVLECDWPGLADLHLTSSEVRAASEEVALVGGELVEAGLRKVTADRNREIMAARLGLRGDAVVLRQIGERFGISAERVRQIQKKCLSRLKRVDNGMVRRSWHHTRETLRSALCAESGTELVPDLVHSFVRLALPAAPMAIATRVVAYLSGQPSCDELVDIVDRLEQDLQERRKRELAEAAALARVDARVMLLVDAAAWPARPHNESPLLRDLRPRREPVGWAESFAGQWQSDKLGRAVGHESGIELQLIRLLDTASVVGTYCEQPVAIPYHVDGEAHRYYPDLLVRLEDGRNVLVEVKARLYDFAIWPNQLKFAAASRFAHEHGWGFLAVTAGTLTLRDLVARRIASDLEDHLRYRLAKGPMGWRAVTEVRARFDATHNDIAAVIWRNRWRWQVRPYLLRATASGGP